MKLITRIFILFCMLCMFGILVTCEKDEAEKINQPPKIQSTTGSPQSIKTGETTQLTCVATDPDGDQLTYSWSSSKGSFPNGTSGSNVTWKAPDEPGNIPISIIVNDGQNTANGSVNITVEANLQLSVTPVELNFGTTDSEKIFEIKNNGSGTLSWSISENIEWLTLSTVSGESTTETDQVTVTVDRSELDPGSYNGTITITSDGGDQDIAVSMEVPEVPTLSVHQLVWTLVLN